MKKYQFLKQNIKPALTQDQREQLHVSHKAVGIDTTKNILLKVQITENDRNPLKSVRVPGYPPLLSSQQPGACAGSPAPPAQAATGAQQGHCFAQQNVGLKSTAAQQSLLGLSQGYGRQEKIRY